ncbi:MAG TPA: hypothetical protein VMQ67_12305 [Candidatus Saccharimonadales bacterium]|nr:hypothetical protein [Candidatus Saccharimonadales bacterium]
MPAVTRARKKAIRGLRIYFQGAPEWGGFVDEIGEGVDWSFSVDFGSAPVKAFEELLGTLSDLGLVAVGIGSFYLTSEA